LLNEDELIKIMEDHGLNVNRISLKGMLPYEIAIAFRKAALLIGVHGAGWAHLPFSTNTTAFFEFHNDKSQRFGFSHLALTLGNPYHYIVAKPENSIHNDATKAVVEKAKTDSSPVIKEAFKNRDIVIEPEEFKEELDFILKYLKEVNLY
jgi:capsular polysaccharide biosynthesis protein